MPPGIHRIRLAPGLRMRLLITALHIRFKVIDVLLIAFIVKISA